MKLPVILSIQGCQYYPEQDPEVIELVTEGTLEQLETCWEICYEESDLTGLAGVTTTFRLEPGQVVLQRSGKLRSEMVFREGVRHDSLYQMDFGALLLTVCAKQIQANITSRGGTVDLVYDIQIEGMEAGLVEYHLTIRAK
ncbi:MAG: DUF1934 domain-containing protein [Ruminococcaceae bacterium]|nr:DUF1934 domain-containing protein [Oscillospiraceae bacterium]